VGKTRAALNATALENVFAGFGCHALKKAVLFGALTLFWLKSSFGHNLFYYTRFLVASSNDFYTKLRQINNISPLIIASSPLIP
jgi:hypothetical protein